MEKSCKILMLLRYFRVVGKPISCLKLPISELDLDSFHQKENHQRRRSSSKSTKIIRIIKCDGNVRIYHRPIKASELMSEFPKHMVCRSDSFYIGQMTPALSEKDRLKPGHNYFLLPANFFQSVLSFASFIRCRSAFGTGIQLPLFEVEKTTKGSLRIKISEEYLGNIAKPKEDDQVVVDSEVATGVCTTPKLRKDYEQMVASRRWKPKLDVIPEKKSNGGCRIKRLSKRSRRLIRRTKV